jgi:hypothetical protein
MTTDSGRSAWRRRADSRVARLEAAAADLKGQALERVRHIDLQSSEREPAPPERIFDVVDYGVALTIDGGEFFIDWGDEFEQWHVNLQSAEVGSLFSRDAELRITDVTKQEPWLSWRGRRISAVSIHWSPELSERDALPTIAEPSGGYTTSPELLELSFEGGGTVFFAAAEPWDDQLRLGSDSICVIFDARLAHSLRSRS